MNCASEVGDIFAIETNEAELKVSMIGGGSIGGGGGGACSPPADEVPVPLPRVAVEEADESADVEPL